MVPEVNIKELASSCLFLRAVSSPLSLFNSAFLSYPLALISVWLLDDTSSGGGGEEGFISRNMHGGPYYLVLMLGIPIGKAL